MERHPPAAQTFIKRVRVCLNGFIATATPSLLTPVKNIHLLAEKLLQMLD